MPVNEHHDQGNLEEIVFNLCLQSRIVYILSWQIVWQEAGMYGRHNHVVERDTWSGGSLSKPQSLWPVTHPF